MNHNEIVKALMNCPHCGKCEYGDLPLGCQSKMRADAANIIETLRNELCQLCGKYKQAHKGACNGCRWRDEE